MTRLRTVKRLQGIHDQILRVRELEQRAISEKLEQARSGLASLEQSLTAAECVAVTSASAGEWAAWSAYLSWLGTLGKRQESEIVSRSREWEESRDRTYTAYQDAEMWRRAAERGDSQAAAESARRDLRTADDLAASRHHGR